MRLWCGVVVLCVYVVLCSVVLWRCVLWWCCVVVVFELRCFVVLRGVVL